MYTTTTITITTPIPMGCINILTMVGIIAMIWRMCMEPTPSGPVAMGRICTFISCSSTLRCRTRRPTNTIPNLTVEISFLYSHGPK